jgi:phage host-nuclease inhibitor protein Gam
MKNTRIKKPALTVPTRNEVEVLVGEIRLLTTQVMSIEADRQHKLQQIDERFSKVTGPLQAELDHKTERVQAWAEANPAEFEKRKSIEFNHGTVGFRTGTPKLAPLSRKFTWATILPLVEKLMPMFIRRAPEIDKEAIIAQRTDPTLLLALPGVGLKIVQDESFFIDPKVDQVETKQVAEAA